ncbi:MAG: Fic family protein [Gammaproteobacteria bacterium]|nr:Fic family protein [Gammaproteobacteria bacterium]
MATLFFVTDVLTRRALQQRFRRGELTRVRRGIYIDSYDPIEITQTIHTGWVTIANFLFTDPVAVYSTACELRPIDNRVYLMVAAGVRRTVSVGPLRLSIEAGNVEHGTEPFSATMQRSNVPRQLLENLTSMRAQADSPKKLGRAWVELQLLDELAVRGEARINQLREAASALAPLLGKERQQQQLNEMAAAILKTHPVGGTLVTRAGIAQAQGKPFDRERLERFSALASYLAKLDLTEHSYTYDNAGWRNLAFFESYFSNYIEGTRFTMDEAERIVSSGRALYQRREDSHDLLSHIDITHDHAEMTLTPDSAESLICVLKSRHGILLAQRPDQQPGRFKQVPNQAGATQFVRPELVEGTLLQGFEFYRQLRPGIKRALFMHFMIAEVHPFNDGNGRMARIMMNAELVAHDQHKIVVPTVCRENYLNGLRQATRRDSFRIMVKVLHQLQQYSAAQNWSDYGDIKAQLLAHATNREADDGLMIFNKQLSQYTGDYQPG